MNFTLTFDETEMIVLNKALVKLPFEEVINLINSINRQVNSIVEKEKLDVSS